MDNGKVHLFVDPITIDSSFSDSGYETKTYTGKYMLLVSSDIDEGYKDKFDNNIRPLITNSNQFVKDSILCSDYQINKFQTMEVINLFDFNLDGVLVTYSITITK
ncbi:hypothetical protein FNW52_12515 [Flavobacterium sp. ZT3R18]|uniref:hypothetical protein n=1 Tax=Flavobacterium sp. ZT3R18 TaxID=2594429 RepID=UPI00117A6B82|nr:hypothetical protein [Flavobacterium sp. ZT3R18]TRX34958.1 hypothetical protein FNW52_12515 [Flavobacterium sp. ZT3R18]